MIPKQNNELLESNLTPLVSRQFQFHVDTHLFDAFSKNLYSYPIDSTVREVISNAVDTHARCGKKEVPISIVLTDEFIVEDFGEGISEDKMVNLIGVYGKSDKRSTNSEIGMYGFGFKAPFSVADQFVVETVYNKVLYTWIIYRDPKIGGKLDLVHKVDTEKDNGTKIRIPVKNYAEFFRAVIKYISFLKPTPVTYFKNNFLFQPPVIEVESNDFLFTRAKPSVGECNSLYCDWMPYRIQLTVPVPENVMIKLHPGEIELSPSRESPKNTDQLEKVFKQKLQTVAAEMYRQKLIEVKTMTSSYTILKSVTKFLHEVTKIDKLFNEASWDNDKFGKFDFPMSDDDKQCMHFGTYTGNSLVTDLFLNKYFTQHYHNNPCVIVYPDEKRDKIRSSYYRSRIRQCLKENNKASALLIYRSFISEINNPIVKDYLLDCYDLMDFKIARTTSTLEKLKKNHMRVTTSSGDIQVDPTQGEYVYNVSAMPAYMNIPNVVCCKINKRHVGKVSKLPNWFTLAQYIEHEFNKVSKEDWKNISISIILSNMGTDVIAGFVNQGLISLSGYDNQITKKYGEDVIELFNTGIRNGLITCDANKDEINESIYKMYPMLRILNRYTVRYEHNAGKIIKDYIQLVNEGKQS